MKPKPHSTQPGILVRVIIALGLAALPLAAQVYNFATVAGKPGHGTADGIGALAEFHYPGGAVADGADNLYIADTYNHCLRKVVISTGAVSLFAGTAGTAGAADGTGAAATFKYPVGITRDTAGNLYVADSGNHTIRMVTTGGVVTTLAGTPGSSGSTNGTGAAALFNNPQGIAHDADGGLLYVADTGSHLLRSVNPGTAAVATVAGVAGVPGSADGSPGLLHAPSGVAVAAGYVFVADSGSHTLRRLAVVSAQMITVAGAAGQPGFVNATGTAARFHQPMGVCADAAGNVWVADLRNGCVRRVSPTRAVTVFGPATLSFPRGLCVDGSGGVFVLDTGLHAVRQITPAGSLNLIAGREPAGGEDGLGRAAGFRSPQGMTTAPDGVVYIADTDNHVIRKVALDGTVSVFAGVTGVAGSATGVASSARFNSPVGIAADSLGHLYVADTGNHVVRLITPDGVVHPLAGGAGLKGMANGTGTAARFNEPLGLTVDRSGNVFVADSKNHNIRKITPAGVVTTFAGGAAVAGSSDGTGTAARFNSPAGIDRDRTGHFYVTDRLNATVRRVTEAAVVTTFAGSPGNKGTTDGTGTLARFGEPAGVVVDASGQVIVSDLYYQSLRRISPARVVSTLAGQAWLTDQSTILSFLPYGGDVDGVGAVATFNLPVDVAVDETGRLYVLDRSSHTLRQGTPPALGPTITTHPASQVVAVNAPVSFTVAAAGVTGYQWKKNGDQIAGQTGGTLSFASAQSANEGAYSVDVTDANGTTSSHAAVLRVLTAPVITSEPTSKTVFGGQTASFSVKATGLYLSYQWKKNGVALMTPSATTDTLTIANAVPADQDLYTVEVSNVAGMDISVTAALTVNVVPLITDQPDPLIVAKDAPSTSFTVVSDGTNLTYRWYKGSTAINTTTNPSAATSTLTLTNIKTTDAASYKVVVKNNVGSKTSAVVTLVVVDQTTIRTLNVVEGKDAIMSPLAYGTITGYQWRYNGADILAAGAPVKYVNFTKKTLTLKSVDDPLNFPPGDEGAYTCMITSAGGMLETAAMNLGVTIKPVVDAFSFVSPIMISEFFTFTVTAQNHPTSFSITGLPTGLTYSASTGVISGRALVAGPRTIVVKATNAAGTSVLSQSATLTVQTLTPDVAGTYTGSVDRDTAVVMGDDLGGKIVVTVSSVGQITGSLNLGTKTYPLKGALDSGPLIANPTTTLLVDQKAPLPDFRVVCNITTASRLMTGTIEDGTLAAGVFTPALESTTFTAWLPTDAPASYTGNYTFAASHAVVGDDKPQGYSHGAFKLGTTTTLSGTLRLADNTIVTLSGPLGQGGNFVPFKLLYSNTGSLHGVLNIDTANSNRLNASTLGWRKKPQTSGRTFKDGFGPLDLATFGRRYTIPATGTIALGLTAGAGNAKLNFTDGLAPSPATRLDVSALEIQAGNPSIVLLPALVVAPPVTGGRGKVTLKVTPGSGTTFTAGTTATATGTFTLVDQDPTVVTTKLVTRTVSYSSTIVDDGISQKAYGFFLLQQLPSLVPAYSATTSPYRSGKAVLSAAP